MGDRVVNVRIILAKILKEHMEATDPEGPFLFDLEVNRAIRVLKLDKKKDVHQQVSHI